MDVSIALRPEEKRFNSTLVQLKEASGIGANKIITKFQFYLSSIKSREVSQVADQTARFQFYLSSIKSRAPWPNNSIFAMFQFYLSSIKS